MMAKVNLSEADYLPQVQVIRDCGKQRVFVNGADVSRLVKSVGVDFKTGEITIVFAPPRIDMATSSGGGRKP